MALVQKLRDAVWGRNRTSVTIKYKSHAFKIMRSHEQDHILSQMLRKKTFYERDLLSVIEAVAPSGPGIAIDCGANIGNHSLFFAGVMGLETFAFEPIEANRNRLLELMAMNNLSELVKPVSLALSDRAGTVKLATPDDANQGMFRISDEGEEARTATLDQYFEENGLDATRVKVIKIDVEGHEVSVLKGAQQVVSQTSALIVAELQSLAQYDAFSALLNGYGFHPTGVYCATPTVVFEKSAATKMSDAVRNHIMDFEAQNVENT